MPFGNVVCAYTDKRVRRYIHSHTHKHANTNKHIHTQTHTNTHPHTHTHTHTRICRGTSGDLHKCCTQTDMDQHHTHTHPHPPTPPHPHKPQPHTHHTPVKFMTPSTFCLLRVSFSSVEMFSKVCVCVGVCSACLLCLCLLSMRRRIHVMRRRIHVWACVLRHTCSI